ncbi:MAG: patatin-like phospholipase family protein [Salibacteraceae bacterium]
MSKSQNIREYKAWEKIIFFFPVQLLFVHLKKNLVLVLFWVLLFAIILKVLLLKYGIPYLFLQPEYLGMVDFISHFIVGLAAGSFIMAFNISSYVVNGFRFPFLATLSRPFIKYCQNNIIIPLLFSIIYIYSFVTFQMEYEYLSLAEALINVIGFLSGNGLFIIITAVYFMLTNKNSEAYHQKTQKLDKAAPNPVSDLFSNRKKWQNFEQKSSKEWKVVTYISKWGAIKIARDSSHYLPSTLEKVFAQNRINASLFQAGIIVLIFVLGWFNDTEWLMIPAAASLLLFFTIFIMIASAFYSWFKGWTSLMMLLGVIILNFLSQREPFQYASQAYGLNYDTTKVAYTQANIRAYQENDLFYKEDIKNGMLHLENWKKKIKEDRPVAVFINVPGGGLRSAMWTLIAINQANESSDKELWKKTLLLSGSSGGMIGIAMLREYYLRAQENPPMTFDDLVHSVAKDKLNPVAATAVMNDLFFRFKRFEHDGRIYNRDRAYAFERQLNSDANGWLNRSLIEYRDLEFQAQTPMLLLAPTISDDGRKLIISSQGVSYLAHNTSPFQINESIEFSRFFETQDANNLNMLSALRMSATFPYVFPAASLPSEPSIEILDAGIRDNYGISNTLKYIYTFREWLQENTKKVVIIQVRDQEKFQDLKSNKTRSLWQSLTHPFQTFYNTVLDVQDYQMEDQLRMAYEWYDGEVEVIELILERNDDNPISLSWHLTQKEKERILNSLNSQHNQESFEHINQLLKKAESRKHH